jgi:hypothetical protein
MSPTPTAVCRWLACAMVVALQTGKSYGSDGPGARSNPFGFLAPSIIVSAEDRATLDRDRVLARTLPGPSGQLAVFVATRLNARPDALTAWTRAIAELKRGKFVLAAGRFSDPPQESDLAGLTLDERDLDAIRRCRPGACGLKLSAAEIGRLTGAGAHAGAEWRAVLQQEFRRLLVDRVIRYRAGGLAASLPPSDRAKPVRPQDAFAAILERSPYLTRMPGVMDWLARYPRADAAVESFFYWSKEHYAEGKPVVSVTHVGIVHPASDPRVPAVLVAGKQIYATHYVDGGLGLTMIVRDASTDTSYLVYVNRSHVDFLRGWFGRLVQSVLEGRLQREAPLVVGALRTRLESGAAPAFYE